MRIFFIGFADFSQHSHPFIFLFNILDEKEKNKRVAAEELKNYGDEYIDCMEKIEEARLTMKDIIDSAKEKGISKEMIIAYCTTKTLTEFNKKIIKSAIF